MRSSHSLDRLDRGRRIRALWPTVGASSSPSGPPRVVAHPSNPAHGPIRAVRRGCSVDPGLASGSRRDWLRQSSVARYGLASACPARPLRRDRPTDEPRGLLGAEAVDHALYIGDAEAQTR